MGQVKIPVGAVEHNDVEIRILLDEAGEVAELGDGKEVHRHDLADVVAQKRR
jgi:hypothetical protein